MISKMNRIFVDFNNVDKKARVRLNCTGTFEDITQQKVLLQPGIKVLLYQDEMETEGTIMFSEEEEIWVAKVDWLELIEKNNQKISD
jgi:hypothetical protein